MTVETEQAEYAALRATIRERGTVRMWLILLGIGTWGALALTLASADYDRAVGLVPFLVLAATFEVSFFIHTGVERVGRYLQVFYEDRPGLAPSELGESRGWENTVMAYGKSFPGGADPLFITLFASITVVNFFSAFPAVAQHLAWIAILLVSHLGFGWRMITARRASSSQRATDLERFRSLKNRPASN